jgi:hypothetical protein
MPDVIDPLPLPDLLNFKLRNSKLLKFFLIKYKNEVIVILKRRIFFLREWKRDTKKVVGKYCWAITLGGAVMLWPIRFQCVAVWILPGLPCVFTYSWS